MNEPTPSHATRSPRPARRLTGLQLTLGLVLFFLLLLVAVRGAISWRYHAELAARQEAGLPTTLAEFREWEGEVEPGAAEVYRRAFEARERDHWFEDDERLEDLVLIGRLAELPEVGQPLSDRKREVAEAYLADQAEALALLHEAAEAGGGAGPWRLDPHRPLFEWEHFSKVRAAVELLSIEAMVAAEAGDAEGAISALEAATYVCTMAEHEPSLIDHLVWLGSTARWMDTLQRVLAAVELDEPMLQRLEDALQRVDVDPERFRRAMIAEEAVATLFGEELYLAGVAGDPGSAGDFSAAAFRVSGLREMSEMHYWQVMQESRDLFRNIDDEAERLVRMEQHFEQDFPLWAFHTQLLASAMQGGLVEHYRAAAYHRAATASLAALRFRLAHDRLPDDLAELVPDYLAAVPSDPFTAEPLIYRILDDGFVIYSVNENLIDSHGDTSDDARDADRHDIPFRVHLP